MSLVIILQKNRMIMVEMGDGDPIIINFLRAGIFMATGAGNIPVIPDLLYDNRSISQKNESFPVRSPESW